MSDLIDRQAALDTLNGIKITKGANWYEFYQKALTAVGELPTAQLAQDLPNACADAISRQAAIEAVRKAKDKSEAHRMLIQMPSAQPGWIPVTERSPNREEYIQCNGVFIVSDGDRAYAEYFDIYDKKCFGEPVMHGFRADRAVTAWMPLPGPWKGGQS